MFKLGTFTNDRCMGLYYFINIINPKQVSSQVSYECGYTSIYKVSCGYCLLSSAGEYPATCGCGPKRY